MSCRKDQGIEQQAHKAKMFYPTHLSNGQGHYSASQSKWIEYRLWTVRSLSRRVYTQSYPNLCSMPMLCTCHLSFYCMPFSWVSQRTLSPRVYCQYLQIRFCSSSRSHLDHSPRTHPLRQFYLSSHWEVDERQRSPLFPLCYLDFMCTDQWV